MIAPPTGLQFLISVLAGIPNPIFLSQLASLKVVTLSDNCPPLMWYVKCVIPCNRLFNKETWQLFAITLTLQHVSPMAFPKGQSWVRDCPPFTCYHEVRSSVNEQYHCCADDALWYVPLKSTDRISQTNFLPAFLILVAGLLQMSLNLEMKLSWLLHPILLVRDIQSGVLPHNIKPTARSLGLLFDLAFVLITRLRVQSCFFLLKLISKNQMPVLLWGFTQDCPCLYFFHTYIFVIPSTQVLLRLPSFTFSWFKMLLLGLSFVQKKKII